MDHRAKNMKNIFLLIATFKAKGLSIYLHPLIYFRIHVLPIHKKISCLPYTSLLKMQSKGYKKIE